MERTPVVSFIICNHNYEQYLEGSIDSALGQQYPASHLRVVVIDGASTDNSIELINKYFDRGGFIVGECDGYVFKRGKVRGVDFTFINAPDSNGPSVARNVGIEFIKDETDYFMILDADDECAPTKVKEFVSVALRHPNIGVVYGDYITVDEDGVQAYEHKIPYCKIKLHRECIVHSGSLVLKKAMLDAKDRFGFYDEEMRTCEDYDLWMRISSMYMMYHHPYPLTLVRIHSRNSTNTVAQEVWMKNFQRVHAKANGSVK